MSLFDASPMSARGGLCAAGSAGGADAAADAGGVCRAGASAGAGQAAAAGD